MILNLLNQRIDSMKDLRRREQLQANFSRQQATDAKYSSLVQQAKTLVEILSYAIGTLSFHPSDSCLRSLGSLITSLDRAISDGIADAEAVQKCDSAIRSLQADVKREWSVHYAKLTGDTVGTLRILKGINAENIESYLAEIRNGETWPTEVTPFKNLHVALEQGQKLIGQMDLDPTTSSFLVKMASGSASLADVSDDIFAWIRKEHLDAKIRVSFFAK